MNDDKYAPVLPGRLFRSIGLLILLGWIPLLLICAAIGSLSRDGLSAGFFGPLLCLIPACGLIWVIFENHKIVRNVTGEHLDNYIDKKVEADYLKAKDRLQKKR